MKLIIASDHAGVELKETLIEALKSEYEIVDLSPENTPTDDYPDFAFKVGERVVSETDSFGVLVCGTGIGMTIAANKVKGIRCALVGDEYSAEYARRDDDANVIAFAASLYEKDAIKFVRLFTTTKFCTDEEKYARRKNKVLSYETGEYNEL